MVQAQIKEFLLKYNLGRLKNYKGMVKKEATTMELGIKLPLTGSCQCGNVTYRDDELLPHSQPLSCQSPQLLFTADNMQLVTSEDAQH